MNIPDFNDIKRKKIKIKNYKLFNNEFEFEIAPITILTGTNSSGKSSFVKLIQIVKENLNSEKLDYRQFEYLYLQKKKINLGGYKQIVSESNTKRKISIGTTFINEIRNELLVNFTFGYNRKNKLSQAELQKIVITDKENKKLLILKQNKYKFEGTENQTAKFWDLELHNPIYENILNIKNIGCFYGEYQKTKENVDALKKQFNSSEEYLNHLKENDKLFLNELTEKGLEISWPNDLQYRRENAPDYFELYSHRKQDYEQWSYLANKLWESFPIKNLLINFPIYEIYSLNDFLNYCDNHAFNYKKIKELSPKDKAFVDIILKYIKSNGLNKKGFYNLIQSIEKHIISLQFYSKLNVNNFSVFDGDMQHGSFGQIPGYINGNLEAVLNRMLEIKPAPIQNIQKHKELIDSLTLKKSPYLYGFFSPSKFERKYNPKRNGFSESIEKIIESIQSIVKDAFKGLKRISEYHFVKSERIIAKRIYLDNEESEFNDLMLDYLNYQSKQGNYYAESIYNKRHKFVQKWLNEFDIADDFSIERDEEGIGTRAYLIINKKKVLLADVGFGINRLFPLLLKMASVNDGSTIFIEEPESNLHPNYQSLLADMFSDAYNQFKHNVILETHSEYLIRKLQYIASNSEYSISFKDVNMYYLSNPDELEGDEEQVKLIQIRPDGGLTDSFGSGFVDESINLKLELLRAKKFGNN